MTLTIETFDNLISSMVSNFGLTDSSKDLEVCQSFRLYFTKNNKLTHGQESWFVKLLDKYGEDALARQRDWDTSYHKYEQAIARMADYYRLNPPYFSMTISKLDSGERITEREYNKMCKNKFALKVLKSYDEPPLYQVGQVVCFRKNNSLQKYNQDNDVANRLARKIYHKLKSNAHAFVLQNDGIPIFSASKGSRVYKLLLVGETTPLIAREADIKKVRSKR